MLLSIAPESDVPLYLQLRDQIVAALVRGELAEGDSLPSVRQLAAELGINLHTVNKSYKVLADEGYLRITGRQGARITARPAYDAQYLNELTAQLQHLYIDALSHGVDAQLFYTTVNQALILCEEAPSLPLATTPAPEQPPASPLRATQSHQAAAGAAQRGA